MVDLDHLPETGRSRPQPGNVRTLLELYGVTGPERDGLIQLTRDARQPGWWHSFRDVLPNPYEVYIGLEAGAASIRNFEPVVVPGLLQTADYAREIFRNGPIELDPDEVERLVEVRLARQEILTRDDRPRLWAVIDEAVIRRVVGSAEVMRGQLRHLADAAQQGKTTIQVMPYRAGAHAVLAASWNGNTLPFCRAQPGGTVQVMRVAHQKLVRDQIPEIIAAAGRQPVTRILDQAGYQAALRTKLVEEARETKAAPDGQLASELADVLEVLKALAAAYDMSWEDVVSEASRKRAERGGFDKRIFLEYVDQARQGPAGARG